MGLCAVFSVARSRQCVNTSNPRSPPSTNSMATIHEQIDELLAADVHNQLSQGARSALHNQLVEWASCRQLHQENKIMNKILEETLATEKPDASFEQLMLAGFHSRF